ncbi:MAG: tetratricopeptide repeat protein [Ferruginibacter sp.]
MLKRTFWPALFISVICSCVNYASAQPTWTIDLLGKEKKPEKFENRKLGSEKMADKKFTLVRNFFQNNYTHYNYYFNAKNKLNAVLERAKAAQKDDYSRLLSYYPYTLDNTATQKTELDSIIYKSTAGILLHDLRNDWVDNMYLLMGKAFFLRKDFDSAAATFQFINYNLFPRKKHEDDSRVIGTGDAASNSSLSIANKEKQNILQKLTALPPSRNDALIWMVRTLIEQDEMGESAGLISTLQHDPNLPQRLQNDLDDIYAYWFYKQNIYDSAATYLEKGLSNADTKQDMSRSEFLLAQLYEQTAQYDKATEYYEKVSTHTVDPLMDIYARLNNAKMRKSTNPEELDNSINNLVKMSKKDKFETYRDIIFYSAGDLALQKPDTSAAINYFTKSLQFNESNISYKNRTFLQLADIAYDQKDYKKAFAFYDSLQAGDTTLGDRIASIQERRNALVKIVEKIIIIEREDSLQTIAAMAPADREAFIKKMIKRLRKEQGLKEVDNNGAEFTPVEFSNKKDEPRDLFANNSKGDFYFYNAAQKSKGFSEFKRKWGARKNTDNWRRKNATPSVASPEALPIGVNNMDIDDVDKPPDPARIKATAVETEPQPEIVQPVDISYEGLMANLPLTPEKMNASIALHSVSLFELAKLYQTELEDYEQAIITYHQSLTRHPDSLYNGEIYLGLYYCYKKLGYADKAAYYKNLLSKNFATSKSALLLNNPDAANPTAQTAEGTRRYAAIYNLFIEGNFDQAFAEKKKADSVYGTNYWSPQLLYIEAVYHIKQRQDSIAISVLSNIISLYPTAKLAPKAERMIDVLKRRTEIEDYLTKLQITRAKDDEVVKIDDTPTPIRNDSNLIKSPVSTIDTNTVRPKDIPPIIDTPMVIKEPVKEPIRVPIATDTTVKTTVPPIVAPVIRDSVKRAPTVFVNGPFTLNTDLPHQVIMILDKVDGTYVNESKNAFARYLDESFRGQGITLIKDGIDKDRALLVFSSFLNATAAYEFLQKVKKAAPDEVSWLPANKYSFLLISEENLQLLKTNKDIPGYIGALNKAYPGKF